MKNRTQNKEAGGLFGGNGSLPEGSNDMSLSVSQLAFEKKKEKVIVIMF